MSVEIRSVSSRRELRTFIRFNYRLYKDCPYSVPGLYVDELDTLSPRRNPAYDFCKAELFLAYKDGKIAGRVAAIINENVNERWGEKAVRFGWLDFIDDTEVSSALLGKVASWGRERGMDKIHGPLGFTDFDREGVLVQGYDQLATMSTSYNYPYYVAHLEGLGFTKEQGWLEMRLKVPEATAERHKRLSQAVMQRYNLHVMNFKSKTAIMERYGTEIFALINEGYNDLPGFSILTQRQIDLYVRKYKPVIDKRMVCLIADSNEKLVGVGISMPSLSRALQKGRGLLFPFGWWHILKALFWKAPDTLDLLLVAVASDYRNKGVNSIMLSELIPHYIDMGFTWGETTLELESNRQIHAMWDMYEHTVHKRHILYCKAL